MNDIVRRDPRAEWIARNRLHPLHAAMQSAQGGEVRWMGPHGVIRKNPHAVGFVGPNGIRRIDRSGGQQGSGARRASVAQEAQLPLHVVEQPAFLVAVVPDMVGGRLSSHDKDLLGLARKLAGNDGAVLAVVFGEHKESAFDSAGVDRLLHLSGGEYDGYAPEQRILALRNLENQLAPRHWLFPDSRNGFFAGASACSISASATSSAMSLISGRGATTPSSIAVHCGQPTATSSAPVSRMSAMRMSGIRCLPGMSVIGAPPPPPQQRERKPERCISLTSMPSARSTLRGASYSPL